MQNYSVRWREPDVHSSHYMARLSEYFEDDIFDKAHDLASLVGAGIHPAHAFAMVASNAGDLVA